MDSLPTVDAANSASVVYIDPPSDLAGFRMHSIVNPRVWRADAAAHENDAPISTQSVDENAPQEANASNAHACTAQTLHAALLQQNTALAWRNARYRCGRECIQ
jgi:hypothetical protein